MLPNREALRQAATTVYQAMPATPQYRWPQLERALGTRCWVKHENHGPVGAFKVRGGLTYVEALRRERPEIRELISATRGNHGQSIAFAAARHGLQATIVVPHGNSVEKNASMRALGASLIEHGDDFQDARVHAASLIAADPVSKHFIPSFDPRLVAGVATYWVEFLEHARDLDVLLVPIGLGSGICAAIAARNALGLCMPIIGVVSSHARTYPLSVAAGAPVESAVSTKLADGLGVRLADQAAVDLIHKHVDDLLEVSDDDVADAMRLYFSATHNVAEGAGAAPLAAALKYRDRFQGRTLGLPLTGGNVDSETFKSVLSGRSS